MSRAAIFPGQGSQQVGMGHFLFENFKWTQERFEEASDALAMDLKKILFEDPDKVLNHTEITQPALLLTSVCSFAALKESYGFSPQLLAGHSVGEYAALTVANCIDFDKAIQAVHFRGQAMQKAVPLGLGGMVAVMGLDSSQVDELCQWARNEKPSLTLEPANYNAPGQIVVSGHQELIEWTLKNFKPEYLSTPPKRSKLIPLKVSAPFHCSLMKPAEEQMDSHFKDIPLRDPEIPIVQNVTAVSETKAETIKAHLISQVSQSVRWIESIEYMANSGISQVFELGSGKVLSGLVKKIDSERITAFNMNSMEDFKALEAHLK